MNRYVRYILIVAVVAAIITVIDGLYVLQENKQAMVTQFGRPVGEPVTEAGLHFKKPFVQDVRYFEKRVLIWDGDPKQIPTRDKTFVYIDTTARWKIDDALKYLKAVHDERGAQSVLDDIINSMVREMVNKNNLTDIIRSSDWEDVTGSAKEAETVKGDIKHGRDKLQDMVYEAASEQTRQYGIKLVDVLFKRVNYIESVRRSVYDRMISERERIAEEKRSLGQGEKAEILGELDRDLKDISSSAQQKVEVIEGEADANATAIYAKAYKKDPEFYSFTKSLQSYEKSIGNNTRVIMSSDSEFYKFLNSATDIK
ncbi:MAG: protease modulator HflC [Desulfurivibrionaceae bacterium]